MVLAEIGIAEIGIVALVIVLLFGASALPKLARSLGQAKKEFEQGIAEGASEKESDEKKP